MGKIVYLESLEEYTVRMGNTGPKFDKAYLLPLIGVVIGLLLMLAIKSYESTKEQQGAISVQTEITNTK